VNALTPGPLFEKTCPPASAVQTFGTHRSAESSTCSLHVWVLSEERRQSHSGGLNLLETRSARPIGQTDSVHRPGDLVADSAEHIRIFARKRQSVSVRPNGPRHVVNGAFVGRAGKPRSRTSGRFLKSTTPQSHPRNHMFRFGETARIWTVHGMDQSNLGVLLSWRPTISRSTSLRLPDQPGSSASPFPCTK